MPSTTTRYDIGRPAGRCAATDQPIEPGQHFIAALADDPDNDALLRSDISLAAWEDGYRPHNLFAFWNATMREPKDDDDAIDTDNLLELFNALEPDALPDDNQPLDPRRTAFRYTIALMLIRSRLLTQRGTRPAKGDTPAAILVTRKGEPADATPTAVEEPTLDNTALADLTAKLRNLIKATA